MKNWNKILTWIVVIDLLSTFTLYVIIPKFSFNCASVLIASLGVLVTLLVAWQIWATIDFKERLKQVEILKHDCQLLSDELEVIKGNADAYMTYLIGKQFHDQKNYKESFKWLIDACCKFFNINIPFYRYTAPALTMMRRCIEELPMEEHEEFAIHIPSIDRMIEQARDLERNSRQAVEQLTEIKSLLT